MNVALRVGIHTGPIVAGVIGLKINLLMICGEQLLIKQVEWNHLDKNKIQISSETYNLIKDDFEVLRRER